MVNKFDDVKNTFKVVSYVLKTAFKTNKEYFLLLLPILIVQIALPFPYIVFPKLIIDKLIAGTNVETILLYVLIFISSLLILNALSTYLLSKKSLSLSKMKQFFLQNLSKTTMKMDYSILEDSDMILKVSRAKVAISGDINWSTRSLKGDKGLDAIGSEVINIIASIFKIAGVVYILSSLNPFIIAVIVIVVIVNSIASVIKKREDFLRKSKTTQIGDQSAYLGNAISDIANGKEIRQNLMQNYLINKYNEYRKKLIDTRYKKYTNNIKADMLNTLFNCLQELIIYVYLIYQVVFNAFTIGDFTMYTTTILSFTSFLTELIDSLLNLNLFAGYMKDYIELMEEGNKNISSKGCSAIESSTPKAIVFNDVWFRYPNTDEYILKGVTITITPGEKLSVVGANGAGKTTFIKLIMRLYVPQKGTITYGGVDINNFSYEEYMKCLTVIFQDYKIYSFSVKENIAFDHSNDKGVWDSLNKAGIAEKIKELRYQIDTSMFKDFDENGTELSQGQQQKLALARAFYKDSGIVILDEPTAALDPMAEYKLYNDFNKLVKNKTAIYISHRMSSSRFCDTIAVFDKGSICEYGSHDELMNHQGLYHMMFSEQAKYYKEEIVNV